MWKLNWKTRSKYSALPFQMELNQLGMKVLNLKQSLIFNLN